MTDWEHAGDNARKCYELAIEAMREIWETWTVAGICAFNVDTRKARAA